MKATRVTVVVGSLLLCCALSFAQSSTQDLTHKTDAYIKRLLDTLPDLPGLAIVVVKDGKPVFMKGYGWANKEQNIKADENTLYYIASSTKSFTAMAAAMLDREGKIKLDDPMRKYLPGFAFKNPIPEDKVTIRNLLTHTSGIENTALGFRVAYTGQVDKEAITKVFRDETLLNEASYGKYNYTNLGYNVYAVILQQYLGIKWQDLVQEKIFNPLGMNHSTAYISKAAANKWTVAVPYLALIKDGVTRSWLDKQDNNMQSAGGIYTSVKDLAAWIGMNMNEGKWNGKQVIPADVVKACHTGYTQTEREVEPFTGKGEYGLGWQIGQYNKEKVIYHFGGFPGFSSHISFMPEQKLGVAVLVNEGNMGSRTMSLVATYAYNLWLQKEKNIDELYDTQLKELVKNAATSKQRIQEGYADRAKRKWLLSQPLEAYTGEYVNDYYGSLQIAVANNALSVRMGNMECISTPYTTKESIRVELIPGSGQALLFNPDEQGKVETVTYDKIVFTKRH